MSTVKCDGCGKCLPCTAWIELDTCARIIDLMDEQPEVDFFEEKYQRMMREVKNCIRCKRCEKLCPLHLDVADLIVRNRDEYERRLEVNKQYSQ
jgi:uncharacterized protein